MKRTLCIVASCVLLVAIPATPSAAQPLDDPIPTSIKTGGLPISLELVTDGLTAPNWGTAAPGDTKRLFVVDQPGIVWAVSPASGERSVFLDVSNRLVPLGAFGPGTFDERGFLGLAFHPDYASNGLLYTYTSEPVNGPADFSTMPPGTTADHQSVVAEWTVPDPTDAAAVVDPSTRRELMRIDEPQFNHNAGALNFGPDGFLYISLGDGGNEDDQGVGHSPQGNAQDPSNVLGKILRIDPTGSDSANGSYGIPEDNPFVDDPSFVPEIWAYGFRNPFRFSFDSATGSLLAADVGQNDIEEVDVVTAGGNFGWRVKEGSFLFDPNGDQPGFVTEHSPGEPAGLIDPIAEYDHDEGIAVVGGFVYRGDAIPGLRGRYVFGDFARSFTEFGRLFFLSAAGRIREFRLVGQDALGLKLDGFGQDAAGELYVMGNTTGTPFGDTGVVLRIVPAQA
jgi:glucose/arabinose dehydrogenase